MVGLYRFKCEECGAEVFQDESGIGRCSDCGAMVTFEMLEPSASHDEQIMQKLSVVCPNCNRSRGVKHMKGVNDWRCVLCGESYLCDGGSVPFPEGFSVEQRVRFQAWCRYQRYQNGEFVY